MHINSIQSNRIISLTPKQFILTPTVKISKCVIYSNHKEDIIYRYIQIVKTLHHLLTLQHSTQ